jgi:hypothetical protein
MAGSSPAMTMFSLRVRPALNPKDREPQNQQGQEDHDEDIKQKSRDIG